MNANATAARRIVKARRAAAKAHKAGKFTLKSHAMQAGLEATVAGSVAGALRTKRTAAGVTGTASYMVRKAECGIVPVRGGKRYTQDEFRALVKLYKPRAAQYVAARELLLAY